MNLVKFIEILTGKIVYLIILPIITGALTFLLTKDLPNQFATETTIYTGITSNTGLDLDAPRIDKVLNQNEYNNVLSLFKGQTIYEEISLRLLASHLVLSKPQKDIISEAAFADLQKNVPDRIRKLVIKGNEEKTYQNLVKSVKQDDKDFLYNILNFKNPYYSIDALQTLKVEQVNSSDMIKLSYQNTDPGICFNTTQIAAKVFISQYGNLKKNIRSSAVKYFQNKLNEITSKLDNSENQLLDFNISNNIINYYEQTKQVTTQNEEIELRLQDAKMNYEAADAVLKKIENEISKRFSINLKNIEILNIRSQLVNCNNEIARKEVTQSNVNSPELTTLFKQKNKLEVKLQACIDSIYHFDSNSQGIDSQKLLNNWLEAVTNFETFHARLKSMTERKSEFEKEFKRYAPLGANTKRIEREINVHENEYLNILNNLNSALQNEQNTDMISNMRIIDDAKFPIASLPSKKKLYIVIAILLTWIFYILGVFMVELIDHRVKTPELLKNLANWDVLAAFCLHGNKKFPNTDDITHKASIYIYEKIRSLSAESTKPFVIQLVSNWDGAGKTYTSKIIEEELVKRNYKVLSLNFMGAVSGAEPADDPSISAAKERMAQYYSSGTYAGMIGNDASSYDYIISVIPSIGRGIDNSVIIKDAGITLVVFNADLPWGKADEYNTAKIKELTNKNTFSILTNALPNNLEDMYGEIPKKRSRLRKLIKKLLKRFTH